MGRIVKKRDSYREDALRINRIIETMDLDDEHSEDWKEKIRIKGTELITLLMTPEIKKDEDNGSAKSQVG